MQAIDWKDRVVVSETGIAEELEKKAEELRKRVDIKKVALSFLPKFGDEIEVNGLKYKVIGVRSRNRFIIKLM